MRTLRQQIAHDLTRLINWIGHTVSERHTGGIVPENPTPAPLDKDSIWVDPAARIYVPNPTISVSPDEHGYVLSVEQQLLLNDLLKQGQSVTIEKAY